MTAIGAQAKKNTRMAADEAWHMIEATAAVDPDSAVRLCRKYILSRKPNDTLTVADYNCRAALAAIALEAGDMNGIYEGLAFFQAQDKQKTANYHGLAARLESAYDSLLRVDKASHLSEGYYISEQCTNDGVPEMLVHLHPMSDTDWNMEFLPGCVVADNKDNQKVGNILDAASVAQGGNDSIPVFSAVWGGERFQMSNPVLASELANAGMNFYNSMSQSLGKPGMPLKVQVTGTVVTIGISTLFMLAANEAANRGKAERVLTSVIWRPDSGNIDLTHSAIRHMVYSNRTEYDTIVSHHRLHKLYPHHRTLLYSKPLDSYVSHYGTVSLKDKEGVARLEAFHPAIYTDYLFEAYFTGAPKGLRIASFFAYNALVTEPIIAAKKRKVKKMKKNHVVDFRKIDKNALNKLWFGHWVYNEYFREYLDGENLTFQKPTYYYDVDSRVLGYGDIEKSGRIKKKGDAALLDTEGRIMLYRQGKYFKTIERK